MQHKLRADIRKAVGLFARLYIFPTANIRQFFFSAKQITNKKTNRMETGKIKERMTIAAWVAGFTAAGILLWELVRAIMWACYAAEIPM